MATVAFTVPLASSSSSVRFGSNCSNSCDLEGLPRGRLGESITAKRTSTHCNKKKKFNLALALFIEASYSILTFTKKSQAQNEEILEKRKFNKNNHEN